MQIKLIPNNFFQHETTFFYVFFRSKKNYLLLIVEWCICLGENHYTLNFSRNTARVFSKNNPSSRHVMPSINRFAGVFSILLTLRKQASKKKIIYNILNTRNEKHTNTEIVFFYSYAGATRNTFDYSITRYVNATQIYKVAVGKNKINTSAAYLQI